jgi:hypothetical protein
MHAGKGAERMPGASTMGNKQRFASRALCGRGMRIGMKKTYTNRSHSLGTFAAEPQPLRLDSTTVFRENSLARP